MNEKIEYATFKDRTIATIIDIVITTIVIFIIQEMFGFLAGVTALTIPEGSLEYLGRIILGPIYVMVMMYFFQATLGMMVMKIKMVSESGNRTMFLQVLLREVIGKPVCILTLGYGYFWIIADKKNQGFHDKIAKTVIIYDK